MTKCFDLVGWIEATPGTGTPNIAVALGEDAYTIIDGDWVLVKWPKLLGTQYVGTSTPGQLIVDQPDLKPWYSFIKTCLFTDNDQTQGFDDMAGRALPIKTGSPIRCETRNATDEANLAGLWMGENKITQADLDAVNVTHTLRGVSPTDQVVDTWTRWTTTWDNELPEGRYSVVGMRAATYKSTGPGAGLARLRFQTAPAAGFRPGVPMQIMEGVKIEYMSVWEYPCFPYKWAMDSIMSFRNTERPAIESLAHIANEDHLVELELQKIA